MRLLHLVLAAALAAGCTCNKSSSLNEKPPAELPTQGLVIDQPAEGATLTGAWTTVSGWADPAWVQAVMVMGAPVDGYYLPTGHVGVPTVSVTFRKDGRFFAPRVPLQDGEVKLVLIPFGKGGSTYEAVTRTVTASDTATVPATLVVEPAQPEPGQSAKLRATTGSDLSTSFQWDFDGDGTFEAEGASVTHTWEAPGRYLVIARTRVKDAWVSAVSNVTVDRAPKVLASAPVQNPTRVRFLQTGFDSDEVSATLPDGGTYERRLVAVIDGDAIRVFSPSLEPRFTLTGLSGPRDVARDDEGGFLVADTGHDRLVRFTGSGALDTSFGTNGEYRGTPEAPLRQPMALTFGAREVLLGDGTGRRCYPQDDVFTCDEAAALNQPSFVESLRRLGASRVDGFVVSARAYVHSYVEDCLLLSDGRLLKNSSTSEEVMPSKGRVVDAVLGPRHIYDDYAAVDEQGRVHLFQTASHVAVWTLAFPVKAVATDERGRLYVAGPGTVELRDFEALR